MIDSLFQYYAFDWIGMCATFFSLWWLGDKHWAGFLIGGVASLCWAAFGVLAGSAPTLFANIVFFFVNIRGAYKWYCESKI